MADSKLSALPTEISVPALTDRLYTVDATPAQWYITPKRLLGQLHHMCQGRLTLSPGNPVYAPQPATPSSTDTGTEVLTFAAAHAWTTGTILTPASTAGGLTAGTLYFVNALSATTIALYATLANALADTSRVNLTASITALLTPSGAANQTVYWSPTNGDQVALYDGTRWQLSAFTERSLALGTLTSALPYDVFLYDNAGTLTLELTAWTSATARATALVLQDGVWCKSGALTRRYLGTIQTISTTATEDSFLKRLVWNRHNQVLRHGGIVNATGHTYNSTTARQWNNDATIQAALLLGLPQAVTYGLTVYFQSAANASAIPAVYAVWDWTSGPGAPEDPVCLFSPSLATAFALGAASVSAKTLAAGGHALRMIEVEFGAQVSTFSSVNGFVTVLG